MSFDTMTMRELLSITPTQALAVALATVLMYCFLLALLRMLGQRVSTGLSTYDMAAVVIVGAIAGRATMGHTPTLTAGAIALTTLFIMRWIMSLLRLSPRADSLINNHPVVVMAGGEVFVGTLGHNGLSEDELWQALRLAGVRNDDEVSAVILEPNGQFSVLKRGFLIDPKILHGVRNAELIPKSYIGT